MGLVFVNPMVSSRAQGRCHDWHHVKHKEWDVEYGNAFTVTMGVAKWHTNTCVKIVVN